MFKKLAIFAAAGFIVIAVASPAHSAADCNVPAKSARGECLRKMFNVCRSGQWVYPSPQAMVEGKCNAVSGKITKR